MGNHAASQGSFTAIIALGRPLPKGFGHPGRRIRAKMNCNVLILLFIQNHYDDFVELFSSCGTIACGRNERIFISSSYAQDAYDPEKCISRNFLHNCIEYVISAQKSLIFQLV
jgi:hypothetical protein